MKALVALFFSALLLCCISSNFEELGLRIAWATSPDAYGNQLRNCEVYQWNGTAWDFIYNFTTDGESALIHDGYPTRFNVTVMFNVSYAASYTYAYNYTGTYMNITYNVGADFVWTNMILNNTAYVETATHWVIVKQGDWNSTLPSAGVTYNCTILYQPYY